MELKKRILESVFSKTSSSINKEKKLLFYVIITDVFFIASLFVLRFIFDSLNFSPSIPRQTYFLLFLVVLYYLVFLFLYSFFKYIVLFFVKYTLDKKSLKLAFDRIGKFYLLNIILFLIPFDLFSYNTSCNRC